MSAPALRVLASGKAATAVSVVGPSGCGKTTLLQLLTGLVEPSAGQVTRQGMPIAGPAKDVAIVFQDYANPLRPWRSVAGNVSLALEAAGLPKAQRAVRIEALLAKVGLGGGTKSGRCSACRASPSSGKSAWLLRWKFG